MRLTVAFCITVVTEVVTASCCTLWLLLMRCLFSKVIAMIVKVKKTSSVPLFPDLGSSPDLWWCFRSGSLPYSHGCLIHKSTSGEYLRNALCLQERDRQHPHDCRGPYLSSDSKAPTWQSLCRFCKTFSGELPFYKPRESPAHHNAQPPRWSPHSRLFSYHAGCTLQSQRGDQWAVSQGWTWCKHFQELFREVYKIIALLALLTSLARKSLWDLVVIPTRRRKWWHRGGMQPSAKAAGTLPRCSSLAHDPRTHSRRAASRLLLSQILPSSLSSSSSSFSTDPQAPPHVCSPRVLQWGCGARAAAGLAVGFTEVISCFLLFS